VGCLDLLEQLNRTSISRQCPGNTSSLVNTFTNYSDVKGAARKNSEQ